jgi:phosphohistidine phosphatase SixA
VRTDRVATLVYGHETLAVDEILDEILVVVGHETKMAEIVDALDVGDRARLILSSEGQILVVEFSVFHPHELYFRDDR